MGLVRRDSPGGLSSAVTYFLGARRMRLGMAVLAALAALSLTLGTLQLPSLQPVLGDVYVPLLASALIAVVTGIAAATLLDSPAPVLERTAARDLRPARATVVAGVTAYGLVLLEVGAAVHPAQGALLREPAHFLAGLGLTLLCLRRMPPPLAWCVVLAYALASLLAGGALPAWSGVLLFDATGAWPRLLACAAIWTVGAFAYIRTPPRPVGTDEQPWWH